MAFNGPLSLMLMGPDEGGVQVPVARWDYKPQDVRAAITEGGKTIQFHLELPLDTPTTEEARLWVRLLQRRGAKVLAHAELQLHEPGLFSSRPETAGDKAGPMVATTSDDSEFDKQGDTPATTSVTSGASGMFDGGWAIARPGQPAGFAQDGPAESGDWRATLELPPSATASSAPAKPKPRVNRPREKTEIRNAASTNIAKRSTWSPERPEGASADDPRTATRPKWSATR
jgi:hypothetical protein